MIDDLSELGLSELFDELIQPTPPPDISMLPATSGWIWVGIALTVGLLFVAKKWIDHWRQNAYRRKALRILANAENDPAAIATLLRETALAGFPRADVASLIGHEWLSFLDKTAGEPLFTGNQAGRTLLQSPYTDTPADSHLTSQTHIWIRTHASPTTNQRGGE